MNFIEVSSGPELDHSSSLAVTGFYLDSIAPAEVVAAVRDLEWTA